MVNKRKQKGVVLLVAIVLLLVITIIGVTAVNSSGIKVQVAGNSMFSMLVYQGAESTLAKSVTGKAQANIERAAQIRPASYDVASSSLPLEDVHGGGQISSKATVTSIGVYKCPVVNGVANSSKFNCEIFEINAQSQLLSTAASARHLEGRAALLPSK